MIPGLSGRKLVIATMHEKEKVLAPVFEKLGLFPFVAAGLNTDLLGTFSGEIERKLPPLETALEKAKMACALSGCDLALASEGSFGPHPRIPFVSGNTEILLLWDEANQVQYHHWKTGSAGNFSSLETNDFGEALKFARQQGLPEHGFILKAGDSVIKGLNSEESLREAMAKLKANEPGKIVCIESDMRAMFNPTRMAFIKEVAEEFAEKLKCLCPACQKPGFSITGAERGLPCSWCGQPTQGVEWLLKTCHFCGHTEKERPADFHPQADPMICDYCNP
jgi:hypothetical protein